MDDGLNKLSPAEREELRKWLAQTELGRFLNSRDVFYAKTDLDVDLEALRKRKEELARILDADTVSAVLNETVFALEFLPNAGTFHALFLVKATHKRYYLKVATADYSLAFPREKWAMDRLAELGLPVLGIPKFSAHANQMPAPYLFIQEAPGTALNRFEDPDTQAMPEPLLFEFGKLMAKVHQMAGTCPGPITITGDGSVGDWYVVPPLGGSGSRLKAELHTGSWGDYVRLRLDDHLRACLQIQAINGMELSAIESHFNEADDLFATAPLRLLHGDPGHHNVFSDGKKITAIIDWEDALCGDPIFDVAYWGTFVRDAMRERFLDGYSSVSRLPADFERRYWLYYLRVAISKTVHRFKFGAKDRPGRPPASQRIQKALSKLAEL